MATPIMPTTSNTNVWLGGTSGWPGLAWDVTKTPNWDTGVQRSKSGRRVANVYRIRPIWNFKFVFNVLRDQMALARNAARSAPYAEFQTLLGFFNAVHGRGTPFFITDPTDRNVTGQVILGSTPASVTDFQMVRTFGSGATAFVEPVGGINTLTELRLDGTPVSPSDYTINTPYDGWVRFDTAPGAGKQITADFSYYFKVAFAKDALAFATHYLDRWEAKQVEMETVWP